MSHFLLSLFHTFICLVCHLRLHTYTHSRLCGDRSWANEHGYSQAHCSVLCWVWSRNEYMCMKSGGSSSALLQVRIEGQEELMRQSSTNAAWRNSAGNFPSLCEIMCLKKSNAPLVVYPRRFYWVLLFIPHLSIITFVLNTNKMCVCIGLCLVKQKICCLTLSASGQLLSTEMVIGSFFSYGVDF